MAGELFWWLSFFFLIFFKKRNPRNIAASACFHRLCGEQKVKPTDMMLVMKFQGIRKVPNMHFLCCRNIALSITIMHIWNWMMADCAQHCQLDKWVLNRLERINCENRGESEPNNEQRMRMENDNANEIDNICLDVSTLAMHLRIWIYTYSSHNLCGS